MHIVFLDTMWVLLQTHKKHNTFDVELEAIMERSNISQSCT
jgi:hypothetical protein